MARTAMREAWADAETVKSSAWNQSHMSLYMRDIVQQTSVASCTTSHSQRQQHTKHIAQCHST